MANQEPTKRRRRSQSISHKKELAREVTGTLLWAADHGLFHEFVGRRHTTPAELLRDIVHDWAVTIRVSGQAKDTMELAGPVRRLHQQIIAEQLTPVNAALAAIIELLKTGSIPLPSANADTALVPSDNQDSTLLTLLQRLAEELKTARESRHGLSRFEPAEPSAGVVFRHARLKDLENSIRRNVR